MIREAMTYRDLANDYKDFASYLTLVLNNSVSSETLLKLRNKYAAKYQECMSYEKKHPTVDEFEGMNAKLLYEDNVNLASENTKLRSYLVRMNSALNEKLCYIENKHKNLCRKVLQFQNHA